MATIKLRPPTEADADACGRIVYDAFKGIQQQHHFHVDIPSAEMAIGFIHQFITTPGIFGVVAELDGRIVGSNFLDQRDPVAGVGPITVDPACQSRGIGRALMLAVLDRARDAQAPGVRLVQEAFNCTSLSLYTALGFDIVEPLVLMTGKCRSTPEPGAVVRPLRTEDLPQCDALCQRIYGFERGGNLRACIEPFRPQVLTRDGRITAYASAPNFFIFNHGVAETDQDIQSLLLGASAATDAPLSLLIPTRRSGLFRWLLDQGLRVVKPMTLMSMGAYREPAGSFFPSVMY